MPNVYTEIIGLFQELANLIIGDLAPALVSIFKIDYVMNTLGIILIIVWTVRKLQDGDFFTWGNIYQLIMFIFFLGVFNYACNNPTQFVNGLATIINLPADLLTNKITTITQKIAPIEASGTSTNIDWLIQKSVESYLSIWSKLMPPIKIFDLNLLAIVIGFFGGLILFIMALIFIVAIILILLVAQIQIYLWIGLSIIFIILLMYKETRGMVGKYILTIVGLTLYKPLVLLVVFFNYKITNYAISNMTYDSGSLSSISNTLNVIGYIFLIGVALFVCIYLIAQIPRFISEVIGAGGGVGEQIASKGAKGMAQTAGTGAGAAAGAGAGLAKHSYQKAGGGIGGLLSAGTSIMTGGIGNLAKGGWNAMSSENKKIGNIGEAINNKINQTQRGAAANDMVSKGVTQGTKAIKAMLPKKKKGE